MIFGLKAYLSSSNHLAAREPEVPLGDTGGNALVLVDANSKSSGKGTCFILEVCGAGLEGINQHEGNRLRKAVSEQTQGITFEFNR